MTDEPPKVFISHNSLDKGAIVPLLQRLNEDFQVETWLDEWDLRPAHEWEPAIEKDLRACNSCAVFLGASGWGKHHIVEAKLALAYRKQHPGFAVIPILLPGARAEDMAVFGDLFSRQHRVDFTDGTENNEEAFRRLLAAVRGEAPGPPPLTLFTIKRDASQWHQMSLKDKVSVLYRGAELRQAQALARLQPPEKLTDLALRFLLESEAEEQRQLERERARNRRIIFGLTVGLISISAAAVYAAFKRNEAVAQRDKAARRLVAQRVHNGTRAAVDGDLWGAWSWYANALQLARQSNLDERAHRERLGGLRWQLPHLRQLWFADGNAPAAVVSPDAEAVAITPAAYSSLPTGTTGQVIELFRVRDGARFAEIRLGPCYLREVAFSPRGDELWTLRYAHDEGGLGRRLIAAVHSLPDATLKASREIKMEHAQLLWLDARTLAVIDYRAAHLIRFADGAVEVTTVEGPPGAYVRAISLDGSLCAARMEKEDRLLIRSAGMPWGRAVSLDVDRHSPVVFSQSGQHLVTVEDEKLVVWRLGGKPEKVVGSLLGGSVVAYQFDRDGRLLLTESRGNGSYVSTLWRVEGATLLKSFDHEKILARWEFPADARGGTSFGSGAVMGASAVNPFERRAVLSDDGQRLITVSESTRSYRVWDVETGEALTPPLSHGGSKPLSVSFSRDGRAVVGSAHDGTTKFWDVALPRRFRPLIGQPGVVSSLHFTGAGHLLSLSGGRARLLDWNSGREVAALDTGLKLEEVWLAAGGRLVVGRQADRFRLWNAETFAPIADWLEHSSVRAVAVSENALYAVSWDLKFDTPPTVRLWNLRQGQLLAEINPGEGSVVAAGIDERQNMALLVFRAKEARGYDLVVHDLVTKETSRPRNFQSFSFAGLFYDAREGCWMGFDGRRFWRLAWPDLDEPRPYSTATGSLTKYLTATEDGTRAVLANAEGLIAQVVDVRTGEPLTPEFRHEWKITKADINPEGTRLLTVSGNKAHLWDLTTGDALVPVVRYPQTVTASALHPTEGTFAVSAEKEVGDHRFSIFVESLTPETADAGSLVAYGEVNGEQRVDAVGGRLSLSVRELADAWSSLFRRDPAVLQEPRQPVAWFRQLEAESGRDIYWQLYYLDQILALAPDDLHARLERVALHRDDDASVKDLLILLESGAFDKRLDLTSERVLLYCRLLLQAQRPREAYRVVQHQGVPVEGRDGWLLALVTHAAGEPEQHRQLCESMLSAAEALGQGDGQWQERWNAAFYAARACLPAEGAGPQFDAAIELAAAAAPEGDKTGPTLRLLRGAAALRSGLLPAAEASLSGLEDMPLGKLLIADLLLRKGEEARARALLSELEKDLNELSARRDGHWLELADIGYLKRALEARNSAKP